MVSVGVLVGPMVGQGSLLLMTRPQVLMVPESCAARSLTRSSQVPLPFCPLSADSGLLGWNLPFAVGGQLEPMAADALSSRVRLLKFWKRALLHTLLMSVTEVPPGETNST